MKVLVIGAVHRSGVSKKAGKAYDFAQLLCVLPAKSGEFGQSKSVAAGLSVSEVACTPIVVEQLQKLGGPFPMSCNLTIENTFGQFGQMVAVCTGVERADAGVRGQGSAPARIAG